jgi:MFS family permease
MQRLPFIVSPAWRTTLIGSLYAWQGLVAGFALTAIPNHFAALGASAAEVGAYVAMVGLPWIAQPLWGPVVDRFGGLAMGRRRFWVVLAFLGSLLSLARLLNLPPQVAAVLPAIGAVFLVQGAFAALADTATDAMIIDHVPAGKLGTASAVTRIGFVGGSAIGAVLFAAMLASLGLRAATMLLLAIGAAISLLPLLVREAEGDALFSHRRARDRPHRHPPVSGRSMYRSLLSGRSTWILLAACFAVDAAAAAFAVPLGVDLIQARGWTAATLSNAQAGAALAAGTLGALLVGWWTDRIGVQRALTVLLCCCALAHAMAGLLLAAEMPVFLRFGAPLALALSTIMPALVFVALAPAIMRRSAGALAATRFALFMAMLNMGSVAGAAVSAQIASSIGIPNVGFAASAVFAVAALALPFALEER